MTVHRTRAGEGARTPFAIGCLVAVVGASVLLSGCGDGAGGDRPEAEKAAASTASDEQLATAEPPPDPLAKDVPAVKRADAAKRRLPAAAKAFDKPVGFSDGVSLSVGTITQTVSDEQGPGEFHGRPQTCLPLTLTNGGSRPLDLSAVVTTMTYGKPARVAAPVYTDDAIDFNGTVKPGATSEARYCFSVPTDQLRAVTMAVDFDGQHAAATFRGAVK